MQNLSTLEFEVPLAPKSFPRSRLLLHADAKIGENNIDDQRQSSALESTKKVEGGDILGSQEVSCSKSVHFAPAPLLDYCQKRTTVAMTNM